MKKTQISAKIVADSINEFGNRITTFEVVMPRIILAEFNTHRMFSRNSASSRAIPFNKMVEAVEQDPFIPIAWQKDHKGMQGTEYLTGEDLQQAIDRWNDARSYALEYAKDLNKIGVTKQLCNRLLEPFMWHKVLVTATEFSNFFELRCPQYVIEGINGNKPFRSKKDAINKLSYNEVLQNNLNNYKELDWLNCNKSQAEIHIQALAEAIWDAYNESQPKELKAGEWHIPYGDNIFMSVLDQHDLAAKFPDIKNKEDLKIRIATARAARVSYTIVGQEKEYNYEKDIALHDNLLSSGHMSPFEHCAKAMSQEEQDNYMLIENGKVILGVCRNFKGWIQYRSLIDEKH